MASSTALSTLPVRLVFDRGIGGLVVAGDLAAGHGTDELDNLLKFLRATSCLRLFW